MAECIFAISVAYSQTIVEFSAGHTSIKLPLVIRMLPFLADFLEKSGCSTIVMNSFACYFSSVSNSLVSAGIWYIYIMEIMEIM